MQPTIGAEEDLDDDRLPNAVDPDRDGDRVFDFADVNAGPVGEQRAPKSSALQPAQNIDPTLDDDSNVTRI